MSCNIKCELIKQIKCSQGWYLHSGAWMIAGKTLHMLKPLHQNVFIKLLLWKGFQTLWKPVLCKVAKTVNVIKSTPLISRIIISALCDKIGISYTMLLMHIEISWLLQSRVSDWIFTLHSEILLFIVNYPFQLSSHLCNICGSRC
jgi:hypothetical protein